MKTALLHLLMLIVLTACKQRPSNEESISEPESLSDTSTAVTPDTTTAQLTQPAEKATPAEPSTPHLTPHDCNPNLNAIANPGKQQYIYYVTGFNPAEFKCWEKLEIHGTELCNEAPCTIYYVDAASVPISKSGDKPLDDSTLKTHGIGRYEHSGKFWEIKGAKMWGRSGKGYNYYNTNNHLGG
jgi:hypothetical protein